MANSNDKLKSYHEKRNLNMSPEPSGINNKVNDNPVFIIQKHNARNLHYDFRLEIDGMLKSWVIPKGPSTDPSDKRLAILTEDHPLDYSDFEGIIPEGNYGAGEVIVWDTGIYKNITENKQGRIIGIEEALNSGRITLWLEGKKLQGGYALIKISSKDNSRWLLVKVNDNKVDTRRNPVSTEPQSVISGKTIEDLQNEPLWDEF